MANIIFKNVTLSYDGYSYGLIDFDCEISSGEFVGVIGASGAGKSTFLKLIAGILKPQCGEMYIDDELINDVPAKKRNVAMLFQELALYPNYNVFENVAAYLRFNKIESEIVFETVYNALKLFGIEDLANRRIKELSGGQLQRVALAKVFVRKPKVLLLDEPLSNVDEASRKNYRQNIKDLKKLLPDTTFVYVSHNVSELMILTDRILVIDGGRNVAFAKTFDIVNYPPTLHLAQMFLNDNVLFIKDNWQFDEFYRLSLNNNYDGDVIKYNKKNLLYNNNLLVGGVARSICVEGKLIDKVIEFNKYRINLPFNMKQRLLKDNGKIIIKFQLDKIHYEKFDNDFKIEINVVDKDKNYLLITFFEKYFIIDYNEELINNTLYYNVNDLLINSRNGEKILANYNIYPNEIIVDSKNKKYVKISNSKVFFTHFGTAVLEKEGLKITEKKVIDSIKISSIISEELISSEKKLIYADISGFNKYVTFYLPTSIQIKYNIPLYLKINKDLFKLLK